MGFGRSPFLKTCLTLNFPCGRYLHDERSSVKMRASLLLLLRSLLDVFLTACVLSFIFTAHIADALCYTPSGDVSNDLSCNPGSGSGTSICCRSGYSCTTAKLCLKVGHANSSGLAFDGTYIRGTCEDRTWKAAECGGNCVKGMP